MKNFMLLTVFAMITAAPVLAHADESWSNEEFGRFLKSELMVADYVDVTKLDKKFNWGAPRKIYALQFSFGTSELGTQEPENKVVTFYNKYRANCDLSQSPYPGHSDVITLEGCKFEYWSENSNPKNSRWQPIENWVLLRDLYGNWSAKHLGEPLTGELPGSSLLGNFSFGAWNIKHASGETASIQPTNVNEELALKTVTGAPNTDRSESTPRPATANAID